MRKPAAFTTLVAAITVASAVHAVDLSRQISFDISVQPLGQALADFSRQSDVIVVSASEITAGKLSKAVNAKTTAEKALQQLLEGSKLVYTQEEDGSIIVKQPVKVSLGEDSAAYSTQNDAQSSPSGDNFSPAPQSQLATGLDANAPVALQEVVVTAQRREERLVDTPASVTVLDTGTMSKLGINNIPDFADSVPGMIVDTLGAGNTQISFRGVTTGVDISATTAMYYDDVPIGCGATFFTPDAALFDLDRIEALHGPQGTLYGVSAMGGLVKYVTKMPDLNNFGGNTQVGVSDIYSGGVGYNAAAAVNVPIIPNVLGVNWTNIQVDSFAYIYSFVINAPEGASITGTELAFNARPVRDLTLTTSLDYQDAFLRDASAGLGAFAGERLPNVPHFTGSFGGDYTFSHDRFQPRAGISFRYVDARWSSFDNDQSYPQYHLPDYAIVDLRGGARLGVVDAQLYIRNALNKYGQVSAVTGNSQYSQVAISQPRTIGFNLSMPF